MISAATFAEPTAGMLEVIETGGRHRFKDRFISRTLRLAANWLLDPTV
jgi:hypothetical protein